MKWTKIVAGKYESNMNWKIKKTHDHNIFTGREMSEQGWEIFDENNNKLDYAFTLKEAKRCAEYHLAVKSGKEVSYVDYMYGEM